MHQMRFQARYVFFFLVWLIDNCIVSRLKQKIVYYIYIIYLWYYNKWNPMGFMKPTTCACRILHLWLQAWVSTGTGTGCLENPRVAHGIPYSRGQLCHCCPAQARRRNTRSIVCAPIKFQTNKLEKIERAGLKRPVKKEGGPDHGKFRCLLLLSSQF